MPAGRPANQPASQSSSQPASQPASQPVQQSANQPTAACQLASQPQPTMRGGHLAAWLRVSAASLRAAVAAGRTERLARGSLGVAQKLFSSASGLTPLPPTFCRAYASAADSFQTVPPRAASRRPSSLLGVPKWHLAVLGDPLLPLPRASIVPRRFQIDMVQIN